MNWRTRALRSLALECSNIKAVHTSNAYKKSLQTKMVSTLADRSMDGLDVIPAPGFVLGLLLIVLPVIESY